MVLTNNLSPLCWVGGDDFAIVLPPFALDLNEVMGVYPRFKGSFVLGWQCGESSDEDFFWENDNAFVIVFPLIVVSPPR